MYRGGLFWGPYLDEGGGPYLLRAMVEQQLDGEVGPQLPLEGSALQRAAQRGHAVVVDGVDVGPAPQEEARQAGVGRPARLVQGAPLRLVPGVDVGTVGGQQPAKLQRAVAGTGRLPAEDAEGCFLPRAARVDVRPVTQVEAGMVAEAVPGRHVQHCLPLVLAGQVDGGPMSQQELGASAKRWGGWRVVGLWGMGWSGSHGGSWGERRSGWGWGSERRWAPTGVVALEGFGREQQKVGRATLCPAAHCGGGGLGQCLPLALDQHHSGTVIPDHSCLL